MMSQNRTIGFSFAAIFSLASLLLLRRKAQ
jgi:hypothetical protein